MMTRGLIVGAAFALAACEAGGVLDLNDPGTNRLFTMPTAEYYAAKTIAGQIAQNCALYSYATVLDAELDEARNEVGRGSLSARSLRNAIELETDVARRSFQAKHDVELNGGDLCPAGDAEKLEGSAIGALLIPA